VEESEWVRGRLRAAAQRVKLAGRPAPRTRAAVRGEAILASVAARHSQVIGDSADLCARDAVN
jgi:hypothetical protein